MDGFPPSEIAYQEAHISDNRSTLLIVICSVFTGAAVLSFIFRILARQTTQAHIGLDDYLSLGATVGMGPEKLIPALVANRIPDSFDRAEYFSMSWYVGNFRFYTSTQVLINAVGHYGIGRHLLFVAKNPENFINIGKVINVSGAKKKLEMVSC